VLLIRVEASSGLDCWSNAAPTSTVPYATDHGLFGRVGLYGTVSGMTTLAARITPALSLWPEQRSRS
jgi:hypothetical protein